MFLFPGAGYIGPPLLVWPLHFDQSGMVRPARGQSPRGTALRVIEAHNLHHHFRVLAQGEGDTEYHK